MKLLNLDELANDHVRQFTLNGKTYDVKGITVENFINHQARLSKLSAKKDATPADYVEAMVDNIVGASEGVPRKELEALPMSVLNALSNFINENGSDEDDSEVVETKTGGKKK